MLKQAEDGTPGAEVCRSTAISDATFYRCVLALRQLEDENTKLKRFAGRGL